MYEVERMKSWPRWMNLRNVNSTGSLLANFSIETLLSEYVKLTRDIEDLNDAKTYSGWGQLRSSWIANVSDNGSTDFQLFWFCSEGSGTARKAIDVADFFHATEPIFFHERTGNIILRNLHYREVSITPSSDFSYTFSPLVIDEDVWYREGRAWERRKAKSHHVEAETGKVYFPRRWAISVRYPSRNYFNSLVASGTISVNSGPRIPINYLNLRNTWDDIGFIRDLERLDLEDNYNYSERIKSFNLAKSGDTIEKLATAVSRHLDLISVTTWIPTGSLSISHNNVTEVVVVGLRKDETVREELRNVSSNHYRTTYIPKQGTLSLLVNNTITYPVSSLGNTICIWEEPIGSVIGYYSYSNYSLTRNSSGYITLINPVSGNLLQNSYTVYLIKGVKCKNLSGASYLSNLYDPGGLGKTHLYELSRAINEELKVTLGYAQWNKVNWFLEEDKKPEIKYIPRVLD